MKQFLMRSLMFVPAHNQRLLESALRRDADVLVFDIEDSVPCSAKQLARENIRELVSRSDFSIYKGGVFVRVNDRESGELLRDLHQLTLPGIDGFMYPKSNKGEDVYFVGKLLETIEYEKKIPVGTFKVIPLIETAGAVMNIMDICRACPNRVRAVAFGCEDYVTSLHGQHDANGDSIFFARNMIVNAARASNIFPIDTVHINVHDYKELERNLELSKKIGFEGMLVLNPKELPLVHKYFSPTEDEVIWAKEMIQLYKESEMEGKGVALKKGKFVGPPMYAMASNIIYKNSLIIKQND